MAKTNGERVEFLDAMRGLAALAVVLFHYFAAYGDPPGVPLVIKQSPIAALYDGSAAVSFFFVLSGFVLSLRYFRDPESLRTRFSYGRYAISRVFRIWGPFVVMYLATLAIREYWDAPITAAMSETPWMAQYWQSHLNVRQVLTELTMVLPPQVHLLLPHTWTLSIELALSLLVPIAVLIAERRVAWLVVLALYAIIVLGNSPSFFHFMLGIWLCWAWVSRPRWLLSIPPMARRVAWLVAIVLYSYRTSVWPYFPGLLSGGRVWYVTGVGSMMVIGLALGAPALQRVLSARPLRRVGRAAYSIYLVHFTILLAAMPFVRRRLDEWWMMPPAAAWGAGLVVFVAATVALAFLSERWIERTSIAVGKRLASRL